MKTTKTDNFTKPVGSVFSVLRNLKYLLVIFTSVMGNCQAQTNDNDNDNAVSVQAVVFVVIAATMCLIFWACYACICFSKQKCAISTTPQRSPIHNSSSRNSHQSNGYSQNSARVDFDSVPRRFLGHAEGHSEFNATATRFDIVSHDPVRISLPEATLHQGDAPPTYEEAIGMKTVTFELR
jgi:hypothetical protein